MPLAITPRHRKASSPLIKSLPCTKFNPTDQWGRSHSIGTGQGTGTTATMTNELRIGVWTQHEIPQQLESLIAAIFRQQFRKLNNILGLGNVALISSVENKVSELACISAVEEGLKLDLAPIENVSNVDKSEAEIRSKIHEILKKQPGTTVSDRYHAEEEAIRLCNIMMLIFDKTDLNQASKMSRLRQGFFESELREPARAKLCIEINAPRDWTSNSDGEVYFEYIVRDPGQRRLASKIEIPDQLIWHWKNTLINCRSSDLI